MARKKGQLKVELDIDDIEYIKGVLAKKGVTWTEFVRSIFKRPAKNPKPCTRYPDDKDAEESIAVP